MADRDGAHQRTEVHALGGHRERGEQRGSIEDRGVRAAVVADVTDRTLDEVVGKPERVEHGRFDRSRDVDDVGEEAIRRQSEGEDVDEDPEPVGESARARGRHRDTVTAAPLLHPRPACVSCGEKFESHYERIASFLA